MGGLQQFGHIKFHQLQPFGVIDQINLGQHHHRRGYSQQIEDREMFTRLWHHPFIGGNDQHGGIDPADPGQHILDEIDMAGDIHNPHRFGLVGPGHA